MKTNPMTIKRARYDSRIGSSHSYAMWTDGYLYHISLPEREFGFGVLSNTTINVVQPSDFSSFVEKEARRIGEFTECKLSELSPTAQKVLFEEIGDIFPWEESSIFNSREEMEEYFNPQTFHGVMSFLDRKRHFGRHPLKTTFGYEGIFEKVFNNGLKKRTVIEGESGRGYFINTSILESREGIFYRFYERDCLDGSYFEVEQIDAEEANRLIASATK